MVERIKLVNVYAEIQLLWTRSKGWFLALGCAGCTKIKGMLIAVTNNVRKHFTRSDKVEVTKSSLGRHMRMMPCHEQVCHSLRN